MAIFMRRRRETTEEREGDGGEGTERGNWEKQKRGEYEVGFVATLPVALRRKRGA
jgi:hypothetical protein